MSVIAWGVRNLIWLLIPLLAATGPSAVFEFDHLVKQAQTANKRGDTGAHLRAVLKLEGFLHHSPDSVESAALAYAEAGNEPQALESLAEFAAMGTTDEAILQDRAKAWARFKGDSRYLAILEQIRANAVPVTKAQVAMVLADTRLLPEDVDYDPASGSFLITSVLENKVVRVNQAGQVSNFASSPSRWPMLAIKIDSSSGLVWATEVALSGFVSVPKDEWGRSALLCFSLKSGQLLRRIEGPKKSALGDMSLDADGSPILSDGDGGGVYRLSGDRLSLINGQDFISPQTSARLPGTSSVLVPDYARGIALLDMRNGRVQWLSSSRAGADALSGVDGLYYKRGSIILTQNGTSPERVMEMRLDTSHTRVVSHRVIAQGGSELGDPTHGVIVGDDFYFIANSGWNHLDDHGVLKAGEQLTAGKIMRYSLD